MYIEGNQFFKIDINQFAIKAQAHAFNPIDVNIKYKDLYKIFKDIANKENLKYTVKGKVGTLKIPGKGVYELPINHTGTLPAIKIKLKVVHFKVSPKYKKFKVDQWVKKWIKQPVKSIVRLKKTVRIPISKLSKKDLSLSNIKRKVRKATLRGRNYIKQIKYVKKEVIKHVKKLKKVKITKIIEKMADIEVTFDLKIKNYTKSHIQFSNFKTNFKLGKFNILKGASKTIPTNNNKELIYRFKNTINLYRLSKAVKSLLLDKKSSKYQFDGSFTLKLPAPFGSKVIPFKKKGKLSW